MDAKRCSHDADQIIIILITGPQSYSHGHGSSVGSESTLQAEISSTDSRRASCQLLVKELALNTSKLPPVGLPKNSVVK